MTNQFARSDPYRGFADVSPLTGSEWVAQQLPGATLIMASTPCSPPIWLPIPGTRTATRSSSSPVTTRAPRPPSHVLAEFGFAPVDLGALREGGALMQLGGPLSGKHFLFQG
ncbi:hypothetical protein AAH991_32295 [Microbispora sp. ZYX-F-249]|uniref:Uncharacterized protein n=1 Tax=Microbispora maris TaxID=3144104 RepID=A0ABV0AX45_9ACTN